MNLREPDLHEVLRHLTRDPEATARLVRRIWIRLMDAEDHLHELQLWRENCDDDDGYADFDEDEEPGDYGEYDA